MQRAMSASTFGGSSSPQAELCLFSPSLHPSHHAPHLCRLLKLPRGRIPLPTHPLLPCHRTEPDQHPSSAGKERGREVSCMLGNHSGGRTEGDGEGCGEDEVSRHQHVSLARGRRSWRSAGHCRWQQPSHTSKDRGSPGEGRGHVALRTSAGQLLGERKWS